MYEIIYGTKVYVRIMVEKKELWLKKKLKF